MTRIKKRAAVVLAMVAAIPLALSACSTGGTDGGDNAAGEPKFGGELTFAVNSYPPCLDVAQSARAQNATRQILDNLVDQDKKTSEIIPWLAKSWDVSADGLKYTFELRDDVKFTNGEKFNAQVAVDNFTTVLELGKMGKAAQASSYLAAYENSKAVGEYTLEINLKEPSAGFLQALAENPLSMLSPETLKATPEDRCAGKIIASGPFKFSEIVINEKIVMVANEDYNWGSKNMDHEGRPYLDKLTFQTIAEQSVRIGSTVSGQVQGTDEIQPVDYPTLQAAGVQSVGRPAGGQVLSFLPNTAPERILSDKAVRQAIQVAIDRATISKTLFDPEYQPPAKSIISSSVPGWADVSAGMKHDPEKAKKILDDAGWKLGSDGVRVKDGKRLEIQIKWSFAGFQSMMEMAQQNLAEVGIKLELKLLGNAEMTEAQNARDYDLIYGDLTRPDPDVLLSNFHGSFSRYLPGGIPELTAMLDEQRTEVDETKRFATVKKIQEYIVNNAIAFPIVEMASVMGFGKNVHGVWQEVPRWPNFYDAWIDN